MTDEDREILRNTLRNGREFKAESGVFMSEAYELVVEDEVLAEGFLRMPGEVQNRTLAILCEWLREGRIAAL